MMFRHNMLFLCGVLASGCTAWAQLAGPAVKAPAAHQLPEVPTYIVIGDMAKGVSLRELFIERKLLDEKGGGQLAGQKFKAVILNTNDTQHPFPDASRQPGEQVVVADPSDPERLVFRLLLRNIGGLSAKTWIFVKDADARWKQVTLFFGAEAGPFQVALFDTAQVGPTAQPFGVARLGRNLLTEANLDGALKVTVAPELQARLQFYTGSSGHPLALHLTSAKLREGERSPDRVLAGAVRRAQHEFIYPLHGIPSGSLVIDFTAPIDAPNSINLTAEPAEPVVAVRGLPLTCYTDPQLSFVGAGQRLLPGYCPEKLTTFTAYLKYRARTNAVGWDPWEDYVEYLRALLSVEQSHAHFAALANSSSLELHTTKLRSCQDSLKRVILMAREITKLTKPLTDSSFLDLGSGDLASTRFAQEWNLLLGKSSVQQSMMAERTQFKENGCRVPASRLEPVGPPPPVARATAPKALPQTLADLGIITLNMKLQNYDWPLVEFSEAP